MNLQTNQKGFTIVELLIVIVVIAILAAISIVAYTGIQNRARTSTAQTIAKEFANKAEIYAADHDGRYPTLDELTAATGTAALSESAKGKAIASTAVTEALPVSYVVCDSDQGVRVQYLDYANKPNLATGNGAVLNQGDTSGC